LFAIGAGGCAAQPVEESEPFTRVQTTRMLLPVPVPLRMDILFVVDTSPGMQGMQASLAANARNFANVLNSIPRGLPDLYIAVISSDMGTGGGRSAAGCSSLGDNGAFYTGSVLFTDGQAFLNDRRELGLPSRRTQNYQGSLLDVPVDMLTLLVTPELCPVGAISLCVGAGGAAVGGAGRAPTELAPPLLFGSVVRGLDESEARARGASFEG